MPPTTNTNNTGASIAQILASKPNAMDGLPDFLKAAAYSALQPQPDSSGAVPAPIAKGQQVEQAQDNSAQAQPSPPPVVQQAATQQAPPKVTPTPEPIAQASAEKSSPLSEKLPVELSQATQPTALDKGLRIAGGVAAGLQVAGRGGDSGAKLLIQSRQNQAANQLEAKKIEATKDVAGIRAQATTEAADTRANAQRDVQKMRQDSASLRQDVEAAKNGLVKDPQTGSWRQANAQELAQMPLKQAVADKLSAQADLADAQAAYNTARPGLEQQKIDAQLKVAQRRISQADERIAIARQNTSLHADSVAQGAIRTEAQTGIQAPGSGVAPSGSQQAPHVSPQEAPDITATPEFRRLSPGAQTVLRESTPVRQQLEELLHTFESMKDDNTPGKFLGDRAMYAMGIQTPIGDAADTIAKVELNKVVGAARVLKGSSRAVSSLQQAYSHLPNLWVDSPKLIYSKLANVVDQLKKVEDSAYQFGSKSGLVGAPPNSDSSKPQGGGTNPPSSTPQTHSFSLSAWKNANPKGDANAAKQAAINAGYQVTQ